MIGQTIEQQNYAREKIHSIAEYLEPHMLDERRGDDVIEELLALAYKAGHDYISDVINLWNKLFKGKGQVSSSPTVKILKLFPNANQTEADKLNNAKLTTALFAKDDIIMTVGELPDNFRHTTQITVSSTGIGWRVGWRGSYYNSKSDYNVRSDDIILLWLYRVNLSAFLAEHAKKGVPEMFDKFMEIATPIIKEKLSVLSGKNDEHHHSVIEKINFKPVLFKTERDSLKLVNELIFTRGQVKVYFNEDEVDYSLDDRDLYPLFVAGVKKYVDEHIDSVRTKVTALTDFNEAVINKLKETFAKELMLKNL